MDAAPAGVVKARRREYCIAACTPPHTASTYAAQRKATAHESNRAGYPEDPPHATVEGKSYDYFSLPEAAKTLGDISRLPVSLKVLLENVLRFEDGTQLQGR